MGKLFAGGTLGTRRIFGYSYFLISISDSIPNQVTRMPFLNIVRPYHNTRSLKIHQLIFTVQCDVKN